MSFIPLHLNGRLTSVAMKTLPRNWLTLKKKLMLGCVDFSLSAMDCDLFAQWVPLIVVRNLQADFIITQMFFDVSTFVAFVKVSCTLCV